MKPKSLSFQYYFFALILPFITIIFLFTLGSYHFQNNININEHKIVTLKGINSFQEIYNTVQEIKLLEKKEELSTSEFKELRKKIKSVRKQIDLFKNHLRIHSKKYSNLIALNNYLHELENALKTINKSNSIHNSTKNFHDHILAIAKNSHLTVNRDFISSILSNTIVNKYPIIFKLLYHEQLNKVQEKLASLYDIQHILNLPSDISIENLKKNYKNNSKQLEYIYNNKIKESSTYQNIITFLFVLSAMYILYTYVLYLKKQKELQIAYKDFEKYSIIDKLTQLYTRDYFDRTIARKLKSTHRGHHPLVFIVINVNNLKHFNQIYGYKKGNVILQVVAKILQNTLNRSEDYLFRLGDKEFGILMSNMPYEKAIEFANIIKEKIDKSDIEYIKNEQGQEQKLTVSLGIVYLNSGDQYEEIEVFNGAFQAIEATKDMSKSTISIYDPTTDMINVI